MKDVYWASLPYQINGSDIELNKNDDNNRVEAKSNRIYYYTEVSRGKNLSLNMKIQELSKDLISRKNSLSMDDPGKIYLHINSYGG